MDNTSNSLNFQFDKLSPHFLCEKILTTLFCWSLKGSKEFLDKLPYTKHPLHLKTTRYKAKYLLHVKSIGRIFLSLFTLGINTVFYRDVIVCYILVPNRLLIWTCSRWIHREFCGILVIQLDAFHEFSD